MVQNFITFLRYIIYTIFLKFVINKFDYFDNFFFLHSYFTNKKTKNKKYQKVIISKSDNLVKNKNITSSQFVQEDKK